MKNDIGLDDVIAMFVMLFVFGMAMVGGLFILPSWADRYGQGAVLPVAIMWTLLSTKLSLDLMRWRNKIIVRNLLTDV